MLKYEEMCKEILKLSSGHYTRILSVLSAKVIQQKNQRKTNKKTKPRTTPICLFKGAITVIVLTGQAFCNCFVLQINVC